uniref:Lipoprotein n=1 Tax=uncultured bacterium contig00147 TaxID=1181587 RepID=A0A806K1G8_9BACT|nr:hypothetical protein [uncultured bacterium contig00147]
MQKKYIIIFLFCLLSFLACGSSPSSSPSPAPAPGDDNASSVNASGQKPDWVDAIDSVYNKSQYAAAVGRASSRDMAEKNAFANLAAFFGPSVQADQNITNLYREAVKSGILADWTDDASMRNTIKTIVPMETLLETEIKDVWYDAKSKTFYAAAVMEKQKALRLYSNMVVVNQDIVTTLVTMGQGDKFSLDGFSRYQFAATVSYINTTYENMIKLLGAESPLTVLSGDVFRLEARNIIKAIPIGINAANDRTDKIQNAFAQSLSDAGFRGGGANSRYILDVNITVSPVSASKGRNKFAMIELSANLTDTRRGTLLLPYNFDSRESHSSAEEAENRCYAAAENVIKNGDGGKNPPLSPYTEFLQNYLSQLLPKK